MTDKTLNKDVSDFSKEMNSPELTNAIKEYINSFNKSQYHDLRKKSLQRFSDEALDELVISTLAMRKNENCR